MTVSRRRPKIDPNAAAAYAAEALENPTTPTTQTAPAPAASTVPGDEPAPAPAPKRAATPRKPTAPAPNLPPHRVRAKAQRKTTGTSFRFNPSQGELLRHAAAMEDTSIQELLETLVWPVLEERYGADIPPEPAA